MKKEQQTESIICENCGIRAARVVKRPQILGRGIKMVLVDNVPVINCRNCGESYMTSETVHRLDIMRSEKHLQSAERKVEVSEFV